MAEEKEETPTISHDGKHNTNPPPSSAPPVIPAVDDDSDPDFDDLDDVLDQFSPAPNQSPYPTNIQPQQPIPSTSGPGRPSSSKEPSTAAPPPPSPPPPLVPHPAESEEEFMARLALEMSSVLGNLDADDKTPTASAEDISQLDKEMHEFTSAMEKQGVNPQDLLKVILGDPSSIAAHPSNPNSKPSTSNLPSSPSPPKPHPPESSSTSGDKESFEDTIRRTMARMQASDSHATSAATQPPPSEEDMLAGLLQAMESNGSNTTGNPASEDSLSQMFLGMMEQLTNKDMLYEPMKELDSKYPEWLVKKKGDLSAEEYQRYAGQRELVREIVAKFEERTYSDEDSACREFVWERMQKMQALGSPPEDLIANPIPGMMGGLGGGGGGGGDGGEPGEDAGCPTQ